MDFHDILLGACFGATAGIVLGTVLYGRKMRNRNPDDAAYQKAANFTQRLVRLLAKSIYMVLGIGIVWTAYFMVLGLTVPSLAEYAANASTLIVSVVTLFSIFIAYYEFMHKGK